MKVYLLVAMPETKPLQATLVAHKCEIVMHVAGTQGSEAQKKVRGRALGYSKYAVQEALAATERAFRAGASVFAVEDLIPQN